MIMKLRILRVCGTPFPLFPLVRYDCPAKTQVILIILSFPNFTGTKQFFILLRGLRCAVRDSDATNLQYNGYLMHKLSIVIKPFTQSSENDPR